MTAILAVWNDYVGDSDAEYESWYQDEHIPQRLGFAGFQQARRYEAIAADRRFFTWYSLDSVSALQDPAYLGCLSDPTPRTRAAMPGFRGMIRAELVVSAAAGPGMGAFAVCVRRDTGLVGVELTTGWLGQPGVVSMQAWGMRPGAPPAMSKETRFRGAPDGEASAALIVECRRQVDAERIARLLARRTAGDPAVHIGQYQLLSRTDAEASYFTRGQPPSDSGR